MSYDKVRLNIKPSFRIYECLSGSSTPRKLDLYSATAPTLCYHLEYVLNQTGLLTLSLVGSLRIHDREHRMGQVSPAQRANVIWIHLFP